MDPSTHRERVIVDFLERWLRDRESGEARPLEHYLAAYPGFEDDIARQYQACAGSRTPGTAADGEVPAEPRPGRIGPYEIVREIGRGGQGVVYLAEDHRLRRQVAVKVLSRGGAAADDLVLRFRREAEVASRIEHPGICPVYAVGQDASVLWIAMRHVEGETLAEVLRRRPGPPRDRGELDRLALVVEKTARALHAAHEKGVVHRDVKPANVMLGADGEPVVLDFGLARDVSGDGFSLTRSGEVFGTPAYMAPEQIRGQADAVGPRTDVYALGATLYLAAAGRLPFEGPTGAAIRERALAAPLDPADRLNPAVPRDLAVILETALDRDPARRYASAAAFAEDLRRFREREPILARPAGPLLRVRRWAERSPAAAAGLAAVLLALAGGLLLTLAFLRREKGLRGLAEERLDDFHLAADIRRMEEIFAEEERLHPVGPELVGRAEAWLARAGEQLGPRRRAQVAARERLRAASRGESDATDPAAEAESWLAGRLDALLAAQERLEARRDAVRDRLDRSRTLVRRTIEEPAALWVECAAAVAASPRYGGLALRPQTGLVPLGEAADSGLWEFWHVESGARPVRDDARETWRIGPETGIVVVLLPGGAFEMGADPVAEAPFTAEQPRHRVELGPFFLAKHELTQGQWRRAAGGENPSFYFPGSPRGRETAPGEEVTHAHPVENVTWAEAEAAAGRLALGLPTEAQWEYACRAGTTTVWSSGDAWSELRRYANVGGRETPPERWLHSDPPDYEDRRVLHAPVGSFLPNAFGLHDLHGNVWEFTRDRLRRSYEGAVHRPGDGLRIDGEGEDKHPTRGGGFWNFVSHARSASRNHVTETERHRDLGIRVARPVEP